MRILAVDYGTVRTGLAISDPTGLIATPFGVFPGYDAEKLAGKSCEVVCEKKVTGIIMGMPVRTDGKKSEMQEKILSFAELLSVKTGINIEFVDEKFTTVIASQKLHQNNKNAKQQKKIIDAAAAAVLLQDWLDSRRKNLN